jgi:hypothetical protein
MKAFRLLPICCLVAPSASAWADNPFSAFKGKLKEGLYESRMEMDLGQSPGVPAGIGKQNMTFQHCVTSDDIAKGHMGRRDARTPEDCEARNFRMSGNTASYTMVCKGPTAMTADNNVTFTSDGYKMDMKMTMNESGRPMTMTQHVESRYLGPCSK